jgi:hydroxyacylglutathione hydrolase
MKRVNKIGPAVLHGLPKPQRITVNEVTARLDEPNFVVVDTRDRGAFLQGHLRRSLFAPVAKFSDFAGSYLDPDNEIILVISQLGDADDFVRQLVRIGFDRIAGVLLASDLGSANQLVASRVVTFAEVARIVGDGQVRPLDVRKGTEFAAGHLRGALNVAHTRLRPRLAEIPSDGTWLVSCQSGMRATGACAFLEREGREVICVADAFAHAPRELLA